MAVPGWVAASADARNRRTLGRNAGFVWNLMWSECRVLRWRRPRKSFIYFRVAFIVGGERGQEAEEPLLSLPLCVEQSSVQVGQSNSWEQGWADRQSMHMFFLPVLLFLGGLKNNYFLVNDNNLLIQ